MNKIEKYIKLLKEYNEHTNIYSKNAYDKLNFHIEDSQEIAKIIKNTKQTIIDIGSGSGLPSIIIAIENPNNKVIAVESKSRKIDEIDYKKYLETHIGKFYGNSSEIAANGILEILKKRVKSDSWESWQDMILELE